MLGLAGGAAAGLVLGSCSPDRAERPAARPAGIPEPTGFVRTRWAEDPWALGSYSYLPVGATPDQRLALAGPLGALRFAGEALSTDAPATVHGARASGAVTAEVLLVDLDEGARVVVVGAGAAGAAAARVLADAGVDVVVVEARDRVGGRIATVTPDGWPGPIELGASWVHDVDGSDLADTVADLDVATAPFSYSYAYRDARGRRLRDGDDRYAAGVAAIDAATAWADEEPDADVSLSDALAGSGAADDAGLALALQSEVVLEMAVDPEDLSAWWGLEEGRVGDDLIVVGGYGAVVEADLDGIDVRLGWPVTEVDTTGSRAPAVVRSDDHDDLTADAVIVTVPLAVLAAGTVAFSPGLPEGHRRALTRLGTGLLDKVWLRWDEPWWDDEAEVWAQVDSPFAWFDLRPATGEAVLLGLVGGRAAMDFEARDDDDLRQAAVASLAAFLP